MSKPVLGTTADGTAVVIDLERLLASRMLLQANSGGGKSWAIRRLLEQTHGKVQHLVLDVEGDFHTLREKFDYVLAARNGGDTLADVRTAPLLARRLLELGVSAILDISELKAHDRVRFVRLFLEALIDAPRELRHPALVVIDEAQLFCPQTGEAESASAVIDLMGRGRKRGLCGVLATLRLSKLHKDAAAEANVLLMGRAALDADMKRAADALGLAGREEQARLRHLQPGHFFAFGPGLSDTVIEVTIGGVSTTHPKPGQRGAPVPAPRERVRAVLSKLADLPKEAETEAKTIEELRARMHQLEREARLAARGAPTAASAEAVAAAEQARRSAEVARAAIARQIRNFAPVFKAVAKSVRDRMDALEAAAANLDEVDAAPPATGPAAARRPSAPPAVPRAASPRAAPAPRAATNGHEGSLPGPEQKILDGLAELRSLGLPDVDKRQLGLYAGYTNVRSGGFSEPMGRLIAAGLAGAPQPGRVEITAEGLERARPAAAPLTSDELQQRLMACLDGPRSKLLRELISIYPESIGKAELGERCGYTNVRSGGFSEPLGALRTLGLVNSPRPGVVVAAPVLFLEGGR